jgi:hypothetical protein
VGRCAEVVSCNVMEGNLVGVTMQKHNVKDNVLVLSWIVLSMY